jgi:hypothetical protein
MKIKTEKKKKRQSEYLDEKTSKRILETARKQQLELEEPELHDDYVIPDDDSIHLSEQEQIEYEDYDEDIDLDQSELAVLEKFMSKEPSTQLNLASLIMQKIQNADESNEQEHSGINPRVVDVYSKYSFPTNNQTRNSFIKIQIRKITKGFQNYPLPQELDRYPAHYQPR